jgi:hypothetical protein
LYIPLAWLTFNCYHIFPRDQEARRRAAKR